MRKGPCSYSHSRVFVLSQCAFSASVFDMAGKKTAARSTSSKTKGSPTASASGKDKGSATASASSKDKGSATAEVLDLKEVSQPTSPKGSTPQGASRKPGKYNDPLVYSRFACSIPGDALRAKIHTALEEMRKKKGKNAAHWDSLKVTDLGFELEYRSKSNFRAAYAWWKRVFDSVGSANQGEWSVTGLLEKPAGQGSSKSSTPKASAPPASSGAPSGSVLVGDASAAEDSPTRRIIAKRVASQPYYLTWPKYKLRRLLGFETGEEGFGGTASCYPLGKKLGEGTFGKVYDSSLGGNRLAVKVFPKKYEIFAQQECSVAEHCASCEFVVKLLDAFKRPDDEASVLVYKWGGVSLAAALRTDNPPSEDFVARDVLRGLSYLHGIHLWHSDIKPENILARPAGVKTWACEIADLGGAVEVSPAETKFKQARTTVWYRSPELLRGQVQALGGEWLRADIWAFGIVLCSMLGMQFFKVPEKDAENSLLKNLTRFFKMDEVRPDKQVPLRFEPFQPLPASGGVEWPSSAFGKIGSAGLDFLQSLLRWWPQQRLSAAQALSHAFLSRGVLSGSWRCSPPATWNSKRHPWTMVSGIIDQAVLSWLREEFFTGLEQLKVSSHDAETMQSGGVKFRLAGKMVEEPQSKFMNAMRIDSFLPTPRLVAWVRAFKQANSAVLSRLTADAQQALRALPGDSIGKNGLNFLEHDWDSWFCSAGELHIFEGAGASMEESHYDGGAAILLMAITVYGRRTLRILDEASNFDLGQGPGCIYLGTMTGPRHQVVHTPSLGPDELLDGHSVVLILRTTLFPYDRSRGKKNIPSPECTFRALASSFLASLQKEKFVLPTLEQCVESHRAWV